MNDISIGVKGGQVAGINKENATFNSTPPLGLNTSSSTTDSFDSSPALTNFSNISRYNAVVISSSITPVDKTTNLIICSLIICLVAGLWLLAGHFVQELVPVYNAPAMLTYLSVISLQFYFLLIPKKPKFPTRRGEDIIGDESDLALDTYTNREAFKIAGYLFLLFTLSVGLIIKGITMFPQSSYCGSIGLLAILAVIFMVMGMRTESITRYKLISVGLLTISALVTIFEPVLWDSVDIYSFVNYGVGMALAGVMLLALFFVLLIHQIEHTQIHKPLLFAFIGLLAMLVMWLGFIPLHIFGFEMVSIPPPIDDVYWYILGVVAFGTTIPFYLIQWVITRTSLLFVFVLLGSIIPLYGIVESVYFLEFNWLNLFASLLSVAAVFTINYKFK